MYKIKIEYDNQQNEKVVIYFKIEEGIYNHKIQYKINLTDKIYSVFEAGGEKEIDWETIEEDIDDKLECFIELVDNKIFNNKQIIYSSRMNGDEKEMLKAERHLSMNSKILDFLKKYKSC